MASSRCACVPHPPDLPDLAFADFYLFGQLKQQLIGRTLDHEQKVLETFTEVLSGPPKDEMKSVFLHWKQRCQWVAEHNGEFDPSQLNSQRL
jgi:hypothetical protein